MTSVTEQLPSHRMMVTWSNKSMLVINKKGNIKLTYKTFIKHLLVIPPASNGRFPLFQNSGSSVETGYLANRQIDCGSL